MTRSSTLKGVCVMKDSIRSPEYRQVLAKLVQMRTEAGLTQRELARKLAREYSFVWRIETGKRRLDVVEFYWVCKALGRNAADVYRELFEEISSLQKNTPSRRRRAKAGASRKKRHA